MQLRAESAPLVSVLLPIRQWRSTTAAAIDSILAQTQTNLEILLIGQKTAPQWLNYLSPDHRLRPICRRSPGIVGALNTGLEQARGHFIARMDDDDIAYPQRLETQLAYLRDNPTVDLCGTCIRFVDDTGSPAGVAAGNRRYEKWLNSVRHAQQIEAACYIECPLPHPTLLAHRDVWHRLGRYRAFDGPEDYDLVLRAHLLGMRMGKPADVLLDWREHQQRLTHNDSRYRREAFTRCRARAVSAQGSGLELHTGRGVWLCGTGRNARHWHDALVAENVSVRGFVDVYKNGPQRRKRCKPVISYDELPRVRDNALIITALSQPDVRTQLLAYFDQHGWQSGSDYVLGG